MIHIVGAFRLLFSLPFFLIGFVLRYVSTCIIFCSIIIAHGLGDAKEFWYLEHLKG